MLSLSKDAREAEIYLFKGETAMQLQKTRIKMAGGANNCSAKLLNTDFMESMIIYPFLNPMSK